MVVGRYLSFLFFFKQGSVADSYKGGWNYRTTVERWANKFEAAALTASAFAILALSNFSNDTQPSFQPFLSSSSYIPVILSSSQQARAEVAAIFTTSFPLVSLFKKLPGLEQVLSSSTFVYAGKRDRKLRTGWSLAKKQQEKEEGNVKFCFAWNHRVFESSRFQVFVISSYRVSVEPSKSRIFKFSKFNRS